MRLTQPVLQTLQDCVSKSRSRLEFWSRFANELRIERMAEVEVYEGDFARAILQNCESIKKYYMIDPWKHLEDWNKPANRDDVAFERIFESATAKTDFAASKRVILRGKTSDVIDAIQDGELDLAYIDGDHTLRGVTIDMIRVYSKICVGGFLGGDDFSQTIWAQKTTFEPTLVFPFAVYFAEAVGSTIYALPNIQFCLQKEEPPQFNFVDMTGQYKALNRHIHLEQKKLLKLFLGERFPRALALFRSARQFMR